MRRTLVLCTIITVLAATTAFATTVRGKIVHPDGKTAYVNAAVTLEHPRMGRSGTVYSGTNGMFQLENVPAGDYAMEVKTARETKLLKITVAPQPYTDLAPVSIQ